MSLRHVHNTFVGKNYEKVYFLLVIFEAVGQFQPNLSEERLQ